LLLRKRAEEINKRLQDELGEVESRRREIFLKKEKLGEEDFFYEKFGYSYDWVMVFGIEEEDPDVEFEMDERKIKIKQKEWSEKLHVDMDFSKFFSMKTIVDRLNLAGLETKLFYSVQRDEVCKSPSWFFILLPSSPNSK
jgi:hypothetical protein